MQVSQLTSGLKILETDPTAASAPTPDDLQRCFEQLQEELATTHSAREQDLLECIDSMQSRHVALRTQFKSLTEAYRHLRYQVEDAMAQSSGATLAVSVVHESKLLDAAPGTVIANDEVRLTALPGAATSDRSLKTARQRPLGASHPWEMLQTAALHMIATCGK